MVVLERLREKLRDLGFVPMVFNFDKPETKDFTETVRLLASLSKFVIVDITNPRSAPLELQATVPDTMVVRPHPSARGRTVLNVRRLAEQVRLGAGVVFIGAKDDGTPSNLQITDQLHADDRGG